MTVFRGTTVANHLSDLTSETMTVKEAMIGVTLSLDARDWLRVGNLAVETRDVVVVGRSHGVNAVKANPWQREFDVAFRAVRDGARLARDIRQRSKPARC